MMGGRKQALAEYIARLCMLTLMPVVARALVFVMSIVSPALWLLPPPFAFPPFPPFPFIDMVGCALCNVCFSRESERGVIE